MTIEKLKQGISRANYMDFHGIRYIRLDEILEIIDKTLPQFTESERLAILWYKENKSEAVKFLMVENNWGLKETKDFLDLNSQKTN